MKSTLKQHLIGPALAACALFAVAGCMSDVSQHMMARQSMTDLQRAAHAEPSEQDLAMSCPAIDTELSTLYARLETINKGERARQRKASLTSGLLDAGLSMAAGSAMAHAGSAEGLRQVGAATSVASTAADVATSGSGPTARTYNEGMAITERSALLERVKLSKGC